MTPLWYTDVYGELTSPQRLRYNRLQGMYLNEQTAFFETTFGQSVLPALIDDPGLAFLHETLRRFRTDEERHTTMFRRWNRKAAHELYGEGDSFFVRIPRGLSFPLGWVTRRPQRFPMLVWLMLVQEERALHYGREILRHAGGLDPSFVALHRLHLADEAHHVCWDEELLDVLWDRAGRFRRRMNAVLFGWMMREFFGTPRRAQIRVLERLVLEFPDLGVRFPEMHRKVRALKGDATYRKSLYARKIVPRAFARFEAWPEMRSVAAQLAGEDR